MFHESLAARSAPSSSSAVTACFAPLYAARCSAVQRYMSPAGRRVPDGGVQFHFRASGARVRPRCTTRARGCILWLTRVCCIDRGPVFDRLLHERHVVGACRVPQHPVHAVVLLVPLVLARIARHSHLPELALCRRRVALARPREDIRVVDEQPVAGVRGLHLPRRAVSQPGAQQGCAGERVPWWSAPGTGSPSVSSWA